MEYPQGAIDGANICKSPEPVSGLLPMSLNLTTTAAVLPADNGKWQQLYVGAEVESFYSCRSRCHVKVKGFRCKVTDKSPFRTPPSFFGIRQVDGDNIMGTHTNPLLQEENND